MFSMLCKDTVIFWTKNKKKKKKKKQVGKYFKFFGRISLIHVRKISAVYIIKAIDIIIPSYNKWMMEYLYRSCIDFCFYFLIFFIR